MPEYHPAPMEDVVVSSRVRLARNYRDIPFPSMLTREFADEVIHRCRAAMPSDKYEMRTMAETPRRKRHILWSRG